MSTLKVSSIQSPSTTDGGLAISSTGAVSGGLPVPNRNLLYNGAMQVAQRGTSAAGVTSGGYFTADRWNTTCASTSEWTQSVTSDAPSGSGISKSLKMLCTTAQASPPSTEVIRIEQSLEGQDLQRLAKGTSDAKQLTLSFWVKSNVTGTYIFELWDRDNSRSISASYSISASGTWEWKSVTFDADTSGVFDDDNALSLKASFWLSAGSNYSSGTLATSWASLTAANRAVGQTNLAAAVNNYWQITGVQLETGPVATEFEHRSFGDELARCQRYFEKSFSVTQPPVTNLGYSTGEAFLSGAVAGGNSYFPKTSFAVEKRAVPTMTFYNRAAASNTWQYYNSSLGSVNSVPTTDVLGTTGFTATLNGDGTRVLASGHWTASAEL